MKKVKGKDTHKEKNVTASEIVINKSIIKLEGKTMKSWPKQKQC